MGILYKLLWIFRGTLTAASVTAHAQEDLKPEPVTLKMNFHQHAQPLAVTDEQVAEALTPLRFVLTDELFPVVTTQQWWEYGTHKARLSAGSDKACSWLEPFVPVGLAKSLQLACLTDERGPLRAAALAKELRALVVQQRKLMQPHHELLRALYGARVMMDFVDSLDFGAGLRANFYDVNHNELRATPLDFLTLGYEGINALGKTEAKWLVEAFGEPAQHQKVSSALQSVRQNALRRTAWQELRQKNDTSRALGWPTVTMQEHLTKLVKRNLQYQQEWQQRADSRRKREAQAAASVQAAVYATKEPFVVADLETTGLSAEENDILEFAAVKVLPDGTIEEQFSMLVELGRPLSPFIVRLTGITDADVAREGRPVGDAMRLFLKFVGDRPVFFHNAPFDVRFLKRTAADTNNQFANRVHDTLPLARQAWPALADHKLGGLAAYVGAPTPTHRAMSDAHATLAVLLAARAKLKLKP